MEDRELAALLDKVADTPDGHIFIAYECVLAYRTLESNGLYSTTRAHARFDEFDTIKAAAMDRAIPIIDTRAMRHDVVVDMAIHGPMIAVNGHYSPAPYDSLSMAPLRYVADLWRVSGADVHNI